jgi:hypothetical protein
VPVGNPVPSDAVPLLYPGNNVPAKRLPERGDKYIVVDWSEALAQATHSTTTY